MFKKNNYVNFLWIQNVACCFRGRKKLNIGIYESKTLRKNIFLKWTVCAKNSRKLLRRLYVTLSVRSVIWSNNTDRRCSSKIFWIQEKENTIGRSMKLSDTELNNLNYLLFLGCLDCNFIVERYECNFKNSKFFFSMPPHVRIDFVVPPPSWLWPKFNRLPRLGRPLGAVTLPQWY
jgi:hypothetical protein